MQAPRGRSRRRLIPGVDPGAIAPIIQSQTLRHHPSADVLTVNGAPGDAAAVLILLDLNAGNRALADPFAQRLTGDLAAAIILTVATTGLVLFGRIHAPEPDPLAIDRQGVAIDNHRRRVARRERRTGPARRKN